MTPEEVRKSRKALGLTQEQLARALGVQRLAVWRWENGKRPVPAYLPLAINGLQAEGQSGRKSGE